MGNFEEKKVTKLPYRKSIRLKNYDYSSNGYYFVTICTQNREKLFEKNNWTIDNPISMEFDDVTKDIYK